MVGTAASIVGVVASMPGGCASIVGGAPSSSAGGSASEGGGLASSMSPPPAGHAVAGVELVRHTPVTHTRPSGQPVTLSQLNWQSRKLGV
jgi:hypothetical protein